MINRFLFFKRRDKSPANPRTYQKNHWKLPSSDRRNQSFVQGDDWREKRRLSSHTSQHRSSTQTMTNSGEVQYTRPSLLLSATMDNTYVIKWMWYRPCLSLSRARSLCICLHRTHTHRVMTCTFISFTAHKHTNPDSASEEGIVVVVGEDYTSSQR